MDARDTAASSEAGKPSMVVAAPSALQNLIHQVTEVPTLPSTAARILEISNDEHSSAADLAKVIYFDQALAAKILRIANSPLYGFSSSVKTIEHAIVILGFKEIRDMALAMSVFGSFFRKRGRGYFERVRFWEHSLKCGLVAKVIAADAGLNKTELFVAGLIHDLGKVVLDRFQPEGFVNVLEMASKHSLSWLEAEQQVLGFSHAEVAEALLKVWRFPPELIRPVAFHHQPWADDEEPRRSAAIYLADMLTRCLHEPDYPSQPRPNPSDIQEALGRVAMLGLELPLSFTAYYDSRVKGEASEIQDYLDCIVNSGVAI
ncbi:MAG: HDOD domain-containing protein [Pseudomonadota bacterium]